MVDPATTQEHRRAVALEQDHGVVDQAGQDAVEVEPAADVAGHPAEGLGSVDEVGDLLLASSDADDRAERVGDDGEVVDHERVGIVVVVGHDEEDAPRSVAAGDGHRDLGPLAGQDRDGDPLARIGDDRDGDRPARSSAPESRRGAASSARPRTP